MNSHQKYIQLVARIRTYSLGLTIYGTHISTRKVSTDLDNMIKEESNEKHKQD